MTVSRAAVQRWSGAAVSDCVSDLKFAGSGKSARLRRRTKRGALKPKLFPPQKQRSSWWLLKKNMTGVKRRASAARRGIGEAVHAQSREQRVKSRVDSLGFFFFSFLYNCNKITQMIFFCVSDLNLIRHILLEEAACMTAPPVLSLCVCVCVSSRLSLSDTHKIMTSAWHRNSRIYNHLVYLADELGDMTQSMRLTNHKLWLQS